MPSRGRGRYAESVLQSTSLPQGVHGVPLDQWFPTFSLPEFCFIICFTRASCFSSSFYKVPCVHQTVVIT
jgi:hypothetical protein